MDARTVHDTLVEQRTFFKGNNTRSYEFRLGQLTKLKSVIEKHEEDICTALNKDLHKSHTEALFSEVKIVLKEINYAIKNLSNWMQPKSVSTPLVMFPGKSTISPEPYGSVFIIGPWNYPFQLIMSPLIGAIAAGNCAILKPSEITPNTTNLILKLINDNFDGKFVSAIDATPDKMPEIMQEKFDYIFFTGGKNIGKIIMHAAAEHLTPHTLELGGKSPCIVDESANLDYAARRIIMGKTMNAGQTCIAPDFLYVHESVKEQLIEKLCATITAFYSENPKESDDFGRIINAKHFERLQRLIGDHHVRAGGEIDAESRYIAPTIIDEVTWADDLMQDEIFGPILPIITFSNIEEVINALSDQPKPLALYLFSTNKIVQNQVMEQVSFGCGCINDCLMQAVNPELPFGGVGESGIGQYHGKHSFDTFSHQKSTYKKHLPLDPSIGYPPYSENKEYWLKKLF